MTVKEAWDIYMTIRWRGASGEEGYLPYHVLADALEEIGYPAQDHLDQLRADTSPVWPNAAIKSVLKKLYFKEHGALPEDKCP